MYLQKKLQSTDLTCRNVQGKENSTDTEEYIVKILCKHIRKNLKEEEWQKYEELKNDRSRLEVFWGKREEIQSCVKRHLLLHPAQKDRAKAMILKTHGNKAFGSGDNEKALYLYTQCLAWMPHDGTKDAGIIYANRSAALFHLNEFSLAEKDAELAFSLNYPSELHHKLYERVGRCCAQLGRSPEAVKNFQRAIKALETSDLDEPKIAKTKKSLEELIKKPSSAFVNQNAPSPSSSSSLLAFAGIQYSAPPALPEVTGGSGRHLRTASKRLTLQYREKQGRFVVANEQFRPGDVILVEKAFVSVLLPESYHQQCFQCYKPLTAPVLCQHCVFVSFCSIKCRDDAWKSHHRYECPILGLLKHSSISVICYMALRILTQSNPKEVLGWYELASKTEEDEISKASLGKDLDPTDENESNDCKDKKGKESLESLGFNEEYPTSHVALFHLVTHNQKRWCEDYFHTIIMALFLLEALKTTSYFDCFKSNEDNGVAEKGSKTSSEKAKETSASTGDKRSKNIPKQKANSTQDEQTKTSILQNEGENKGKRGEMPKEVEMKFAVLLLRCLKSLQFNTHETAGWDPHREKDHSVGLGGALFPTLALFNHSCNPAIVRYFVNDTVVVRAIRTILPGEAVTENYGPVYSTTPKPERQARLLDYYWFDCDCVPCREDWPLFENTSNDLMKFRCESCRAFICKADENMGILFKCGRCSKSVNILKNLKAIHDSEKIYNRGIEFIDRGEEETGLEVLLENIALLDTYLMPPFRDYHMCQEHARKCFLNLGNKISQLPFWDPEAQDKR